MKELEIKWEFKFVEITGVDTPNFPLKLTVEGAERWDFVKIVDVSQTTGIALVLMKRPHL